MDSEENRIKQIENKLVSITHSIERRDNLFKGKLTLFKPLKFSFEYPYNYEETDLGYTITSNIEENITIISGTDNLLCSLIIPCYGVWLIKYRLEMTLSLGFTCLKSSEVCISTDENNDISKQILSNINNINPIIQTKTVDVDNFIYTPTIGNLTIYLFLQVTFGRNSNPGVFNVIKNDNLHTITCTRIA